MNERIKFIAAFLEGNENFTELCERFGISRKKGYKWRERYESGGLDGMKDRSRAPHHHPGAVVEPIADLIVQARRKHPSWGPRKLLAVLARHYTTLEFPVASTVGLALRATRDPVEGEVQGSIPRPSKVQSVRKCPRSFADISDP